MTLIAPSLSAAQTRAAALRVAFLCMTSCSSLPNTTFLGDQAFVTALEAAGFVVGKTVLFDMSGVGTGEGRLEAAAQRIVERQAAVIVVPGQRAVETARRATTSIPIVMMGVSDPVEEGLVRSLAKPGVNVTGLAMPSETLLGKQIELFREIQPRLRRLAIFIDPLTRQRDRIARVAAGLKAVNVQLEGIAAAGPVDLEKALAIVKTGRFDGIVLLEHLATTIAVREVALFALENKILASGTNVSFVRAGGLMSLGPLTEDLYGRAGAYVARLLAGAKAAELPVEEFTRYEIGLNLAAAKAIGLSVPPSLRLRADTVVE